MTKDLKHTLALVALNGRAMDLHREFMDILPGRRCSVELDAADCLAVGSTLRALARTNPQCGDALERVGSALVRAAVPKEPRVRGVKGVL